MEPLSLVSVMNLQMYYPLGSSLPGGARNYVRAVDGVSFAIRGGQTLGLVGESGCGKTTVGRILARLLDPTAGQIKFEGRDVTRLQGNELRHFRRNVQVVFQDPYTSLNPRLNIENIVAEPLRINRWGTQTEIQRRVDTLLDAVGLGANFAKRLPNELSGGQRQRVAIARALALEPKLVICDEPVSALDVSVQAKILNLLTQLQRQFNLTFLFISHDLSVVRLVSDWVAVMYLGKIVETGPAEQIFANPMHPYTKALLASVPDPHVRSGISLLPGEVPSNIKAIAGCRFQSRCPHKMSVCETESPALYRVSEEQGCACFLYHTVKENRTQTNISAQAA
jgi:oligopeptide/dipeptide ABC transporter ATP-binding protein